MEFLLNETPTDFNTKSVLIEESIKKLSLSTWEVAFLQNLSITLLIISTIFYIISICKKDFENEYINMIEIICSNLSVLLMIIFVSVVNKSWYYSIMILFILPVFIIRIGFKVVDLIKK